MSANPLAADSDAVDERLLACLPQVRIAARDGSGRSIDLLSALAETAHCKLGDVVERASVLFGVPAYDADRVAALAPDLTKLPFIECAARDAFAFDDGGGIRVVVPDPWDDQFHRWLINRFQRRPRLVWADRSAIRARLATSERSLRAMQTKAIPSSAASSRTEVDADRLGARISLESIERASSPVVRFVDAALYDGWKSGASDIHFEGSRAGLRVMLRLDGVLVQSAVMDDVARAEEVISRIKVLAQLDITERRVPQDGRFRVGLGERTVDFRVSIMPSLHGEDAVLRLLDKTRIGRGDGQAAMTESRSAISLVELGFDEGSLAAIRRLACRPNGMLLVTGPTGSGKTTTLYAVIQEIHTGRDKIITIEDPVEYELEGVLQIPVNEKKGLTFARGLRSILRHDPDKILVGEIRDPETAEIAVQAALTGHLVFTTVHANNVYDVVGRFLHMDVDLYSFMAALNGVVAQRLLRVNCPHCSRPLADVEVDERLWRRVASSNPGPSHVNLRRGDGCAACRDTGFKGRIAVSEVLLIDDHLRGLIVRRESIEEIKAYGASRGTSAIETRAAELVLRGVTTLEEVDRVVSLD